jgi:hypothetical protein
VRPPLGGRPTESPALSRSASLVVAAYAPRTTDPPPTFPRGSDEFKLLSFEVIIYASKHRTETCRKDSLRLPIRIRIHSLLVIHTNSILSCAGTDRCVLLALPAARSR